MTAPLRPHTLVAELTYQCALRCAYCSNPLDLGHKESELDTSDWLSTLEQAAALGVSDIRFSGGEPLLRDDLERLLRKARELDLRSTLITSGVPLVRERLMRLARAGLDSLHLSVQDTTEWGSMWIAGRAALGQKLLVGTWAKALGLPLTLSAILQRTNIARTAEFIALAERIGAERVELVNTRYLALALHNRATLLPTRAQLVRARGVARREKRRLRGKVEVSFDVPDYYSDTPKACMDGWGRSHLVINPTGAVLPCHLASTLPDLEAPSVKTRTLVDIWENSQAFRAFRGESWMPEPCRSCARRSVDFGGCRCQAFHLTGDPAATDPTCALSPQHHLVELARPKTRAPALITLTLRAPTREPHGSQVREPSTQLNKS